MTTSMIETTNIISKHDMLKQHSLFQSMPPALLQALSQAAQEVSYEKGNVIFLQDDASEWFYLIKSGWVKLFRETLEGSEAVLDMLTSGHIFGETAILDGDIHTVSAAAAEHVTLLRLPASLLKKAVGESHDVALAMLASLSRQRKRQTQEIESLNMHNAPQRIGCFMLRLCNLSNTEPYEMTLPYDKSLIAARLGMQCETFSRALNKLRKETDITVQGSSVTIPNLETLSNYACNSCSNEFPCSDLH
ncbi:Crp/Fnr family transcriptional regulator [Kordiimonas pumila]|uniref:Crp/Fnr family transcriptional regulator n=1 Tax=Kordiimonas pumila TaxID=2161677 RepID=A0ABV7D7B6_9PROT|nr:Crp/Fnr family transcriptional regulator [Kordiimonas pumila]